MFLESFFRGETIAYENYKKNTNRWLLGMEITPIFPIPGQKFPRCFKINL